MSYVAILTANPNVLILDIEAGQTQGTTSIEYSKEKEHRIWHRWKPGAWLKVALQVTAQDDPALSHGYFTSPQLSPGTVYQVAIWERDVDPNQLPPSDIPIRALTSIAVFVLKKRPERRSFFSDENQSTGGTYRQHQVATNAPVHACMMESFGAPQPDAEGYLTFAQVVAETWAPLSQSFFLQITDLLPGHHYYELVRLSDAFGNWEFIIRDFTTLQRRLRLEITRLFIDDDSDDLSNGEGTFSFYLETGHTTYGSWVNRGQINYGNSNLETGKEAVPVPSGTIFVGPEPVKESSRHIRFSVLGREDNSGSVFPQGDELATAMKDLFQPTGTPDEVISHRPDSIAADSGDGFIFRVDFKYWIEYF